MFIDPDNTNLKSNLNSLVGTPGICIFIDLCNSTNIKYSPKEKWIIMIMNTFTILKSSLHILQKHIIKYIGDEIMIYIPDSDLPSLNGETYDTIFESLKCLVTTGFKNIIDEITLKIKASIHYCNHVYNITFHQNYNDFYGLDIDLTARLMKKTVEGRIVISDNYYKKFLNAATKSKINGKYIEDFKGIISSTEFWVYQ